MADACILSKNYSSIQACIVYLLKVDEVSNQSISELLTYFQYCNVEFDPTYFTNIYSFVLEEALYVNKIY